jgi:hypothetical protein
MTDLLEDSTLPRWKHDPTSFITEVLWTYDIDAQQFAPFKLFEAQREFLKYAWQLRDDGRLLYPQQQYCTIKKSGKTAFAGAHVLTTTLILGGRNAEGFCIANDFAQAQGRMFDAIVQICKNSPHLQRECEITQNRIYFPQTGAAITAIPSNDTSAAGAHPVVSSFDELWGFSSSRLRKLYEEMIPVPTRKISCRLVTSHAGYSGESALLEEIYKDGLELPKIGKDLHAGNSTLFFWSHDCIAPWQTEEWLADMRQQQKRPAQFIRQFENRFVTSENPWIEPSAWDACVKPHYHPPIANQLLPIWIGIDAAYKWDSAAIVAVTYDPKTQQVVLVFHRTFQPSPTDPLNFEQTIEQTILDLSKRFQIRQVLFDPYQMVATSQRLAKAGIPIEEFPQSSGNMTAASMQLSDLINGQNIILYPDSAMRTAMIHTVAKESERGGRITKEKASHKIDVIVALAMAAYAAVKAQGGPIFDLEFPFGNRGDYYGDSDNPAVIKQQTESEARAAEAKAEADSNARWRLQNYMRAVGYGASGVAYGQPPNYNYFNRGPQRELPEHPDFPILPGYVKR